jgi:hypothetical protein
MAQLGLGLEEQQVTNVEQQQLAGRGTAGSEHGVVKADKTQESQILQGSSSAARVGDVRVEDSVIGTTSAGAAGVIHKAVTTKMCWRCGVKAHLMYECTVTVFCEICRSTDHAMSRCPILKQPKPIASWLVRLLMHLLVFIFRMHQSNQQREILEWL